MNRLEGLFAPNVSKHYELLSRIEFAIQIGIPLFGALSSVLKRSSHPCVSIIFPYCAPR